MLNFHINTCAEQSEFRMKYKWTNFLFIFLSSSKVVLPTDKLHPLFRNAKIIINISGSFLNDSHFSKNNVIWALAQQELVNYRLEVHNSCLGYKKAYETTV